MIGHSGWLMWYAKLGRLVVVIDLYAPSWTLFAGLDPVGFMCGPLIVFIDDREDTPLAATAISATLKPCSGADALRAFAAVLTAVANGFDKEKQ